MPQRFNASERAQRDYQRLLQNLRNEVKRDLERNGQQLLGSLRKQLTDELKAAFGQTVKGGGIAGGNPLSSLASVSNLTNLVGNVLRLGLSRPRIRTSTSETQRSQDSFEQFRVSRGQSLADMGSELDRGERNL